MEYGVVAPIVLSALITVGPNKQTEQKQDAYEALAKVMYKESNLDVKIKELEDRYVSDTMKAYGGWTFYLIRVGVQQRVTVKWSF